MPTYRVTSPEGRTFNVTAPEGVSKDEVLSQVFNQQTQAPAPETKTEPKKDEGPQLNPRPFGLPEIPDPFKVAGKVNEKLAEPLTALFRKAGELDVKAGRKTPEKAEQRAQQYGKFATNLAEGAMVPWTKVAGLPGAVGRVLQSGLLGAAQTGDVKKGGLEGLIGGAAGEAIAQPFRFIQMARAARAQAADKAAFDKAMTETLNQMAQQGHEKEIAAIRSGWEKAVADQTATTEKAADSIVRDFKKLVPAWSGLKGGVEGLQDMVVGQGQALLSKKFDTAMKAVIDSGRGVEMTLPRQAAESLKIPVKGYVDGPLGPLSIAVVDAGEAAGRSVGKWTKEPGAYRAVVGALDKAGIGDAAARAEYKAGQGLIGFVDKSGALKGDKFNPEALINGMNRVKIVDELRRRGLGDVFRGPLQAARGIPGKLPKEPTYPKAPVPMEVPAQRLTEGVKTMKNPIAAHPIVSGMAAEGIAQGLGHGGFGIPFAGGMLAAGALPKELVTQARLTPEQLAELARIAGISGTGARSGIDALLFPPKP